MKKVVKGYITEHSRKTGISFGVTSAIITTLGLMVGLNSSTHSRLVVIGGILTIAIADAFSDALGIHVSEESENVHTPREIWRATIFTFLAKFIFAMTFIIPILLFQLHIAVIVSIIYGLSLLSLYSYYMLKEKEDRHWMVVAEHLFIAIVVIIITHSVGHMIGGIFTD